MKKRIIRLMTPVLAFLLLFLAVSCRLEPDSVEENGGVSRLITTEYPSEIALTPHMTGEKAPEITVLTTRDGLIEYVSRYENCYDFVNDSVTSTFYDVVTGYDETYFQTQALVVCVISSASSANRYISEGIGRNGEDGYDIRVRYTSNPPDGEVAWHLFLEVPDGSPFVVNPELLHLRFVESKNY